MISNGHDDCIGLTQKEIDECIDGNMTITDRRLRDAVYAVIVDIEIKLAKKILQRLKKISNERQQNQNPQC